MCRLSPAPAPSRRPSAVKGRERPSCDRRLAKRFITHSGDIHRCRRTSRDDLIGAQRGRWAHSANAQATTVHKIADEVRRSWALLGVLCRSTRRRSATWSTGALYAPARGRAARGRAGARRSTATSAISRRPGSTVVSVGTEYRESRCCRTRSRRCPPAPPGPRPRSSYIAPRASASLNAKTPSTPTPESRTSAIARAPLPRCQPRAAQPSRAGVDRDTAGLKRLPVPVEREPAVPAPSA